MAGLPGTGKSTIAEVIGKRMNLTVVSVDRIESAILSAGTASDQPTGLAAYLVAETIADAALSHGQTVIVDAVNAVDPAREQWVGLARKHGEALKFIEVVCSDAALHRDRLEQRGRELAHLAEPSWHAVEQSLEEYATWSGESALAARITLDSVESVSDTVHRALAFIAN